MSNKPNFSKMSTREVLEYLFDEQEHKDEDKEQLYEWQSEDNACDDCTHYDGQMFTLDEVPIMHPNCKCQLVATIDGEKVSLSVGDISRQKYEERKSRKNKSKVTFDDVYWGWRYNIDSIQNLQLARNTFDFLINQGTDAGKVN